VSSSDIHGVRTKDAPASYSWSCSVNWCLAERANETLSCGLYHTCGSGDWKDCVVRIKGAVTYVWAPSHDTAVSWVRKSRMRLAGVNYVRFTRKLREIHPSIYSENNGLLCQLTTTTNDDG